MTLASQLSDERVRELAAEILANPPFDRWQQPDFSFFVRFIDWLAEYASWMSQMRLDSPALYWLIMLGLLAVVLALLVHIIWSVRVALSAPGPKPLAESIDERPRWVEEAERFAASGNFLEASHLLALSSVQVLVEKGHIELGRSDANRILRKRVREASLPLNMGSEFLRLLDAFEQQWFRDRTDDPELYRAWRDLHGRLDAARGDST